MNKDNERFKRRADEEGMAMVQERRESSTWNGPNEVGNESVHNVHETSWWMSECFNERSKRKRKKEERERHEVFKWSVGLKNDTTQEDIVDGLSK